MNLRNEETEAGKRIWRMVDEAASRAPQWIKDNFNAQATQRHTLPQQQQDEKGDKQPEAE